MRISMHVSTCTCKYVRSSYISKVYDIFCPTCVFFELKRKEAAPAASLLADLIYSRKAFFLKKKISLGKLKEENLINWDKKIGKIENTSVANKFRVILTDLLK